MYLLLPSSGLSREGHLQVDTASKVARFSNNSTSSSTPNEKTSHSRVQSLINESMVSRLSPRQSPPIQVMDRRAGYDPKRIPSNIFSSRPMESTESSTVSKDSLFSLNINSVGVVPGTPEVRSRELIFAPPPTTLETEEKDIEAEIGLKETCDAEAISNDATETTSGDEDREKEWKSSYPSPSYHRLSDVVSIDSSASFG